MSCSCAVTGTSTVGIVGTEASVGTGTSVTAGEDDLDSTVSGTGVSFSCGLSMVFRRMVNMSLPDNSMSHLHKIGQWSSSLQDSS